MGVIFEFMYHSKINIKIERGKIASDRESMLWLDAAFALTEPSDGSKMIACFYFKVFDILW